MKCTQNPDNLQKKYVSYLKIKISLKMTFKTTGCLTIERSAFQN